MKKLTTPVKIYLVVLLLLTVLQLSLLAFTNGQYGIFEYVPVATLTIITIIGGLSKKIDFKYLSLSSVCLLWVVSFWIKSDPYRNIGEYYDVEYTVTDSVKGNINSTVVNGKFYPILELAKSKKRIKFETFETFKTFDTQYKIRYNIGGKTDTIVK